MSKEQEPLINQSAEDLNSPTGFSKFQGSLVQGFLNCIARKNASFKFLTFSKNKLMPNDRTNAIQGALIAAINYCNDEDIANYTTDGYKWDLPVDKNLPTDEQTQSFAETLVFCFLSVIARKNAVQQKLSKSYDSDKEKRKQCIINALEEVQKKNDLGNYALASFGDATKNFFSSRKGGKVTRRRSKKVRKSRRTRRR